MKAIACACVLAVFAFHIARAENDPLPKNLRAFAGNTWVGPYHVELEGDTVLYWRGGPKDKKHAEKIKPTKASWQAFRRELDAINIWRWRPDYSTRSIMDATAWIFEVEYLDRKIKTGGDRGLFPDKTGAPIPLDAPHSEDQYMRYVHALQKLIGSEKFPN